MQPVISDTPARRETPALKKIVSSLAARWKLSRANPQATDRAAATSWMRPADFEVSRSPEDKPLRVPPAASQQLTSAGAEPDFNLLPPDLPAAADEGHDALCDAAVLFTFHDSRAAATVLLHEVRQANNREALAALLDLYRVNGEPAMRDAAARQFGATPGVEPVSMPPAHFHLRGDIETLNEALPAVTGGAGESGEFAGGLIRVDCSALVRIGFQACADLLDWCAAQARQGKTVQFLQVNHLAARFMEHLELHRVASIARYGEALD